jgi:hypothetical protein
MNTPRRAVMAAWFLLAWMPARAGPGLRYGHDDTVYPDDLIEAQPPHRVELTITDDGPRPAHLVAGRSEKVELVVTRRTERMCRSDLVVPDYDLRVPLPFGQPVAITLITSARGSIRLLCPIEDGAGVLLVR